MEPQYPENLFDAVAKNILMRQNGQPQTAAIAMDFLGKQANEKTLEDYGKEHDMAFGASPLGYEEHHRKIPTETGSKIGLLAGGLAGAIGGGILGHRFLTTSEGSGALTGAFGGLLGGGGLGSVLGHKIHPTANHTYRTPVYSPEQEAAKDSLYDNEDHIIDLIGKRIHETGHYNGPKFEHTFGDTYGLGPNEVDLIKRYPRLIDAMKQDGRRDRGGILFNFEDNIHAYKGEPKMQQMVYDAMNKQLDNHEFYGWKSEWRPEELQHYLGKQANEKTLEDYAKMYQAAYGPPSHGPKKPKYTPEQEDLQDDVWQAKPRIIELWGQEAAKHGKYSGETFPGMFAHGYSHLDADAAALIPQYPRLVEAMKRDSREHRGGIAYHFGESMHNLKEHPELQAKLYNLLTSQLDEGDHFYGWKEPYSVDDMDGWDPLPAKQAMEAWSAKLEKYAEAMPPVQPANPDQAFTDFLTRYNLTPDNFAGDPAARRFINPQQTRAANGIRQNFATQAKSLGGMTPEMASNQSIMLGKLQQSADQAKIMHSIKGTMGVEKKDPARFEQMLDLSNKSSAAFRTDPTSEITTPVGGLLGAVAGGLMGRNTLQRLVAGAAGGLGGTLAGFVGGRAAEEARSGYDHKDALAPYDVANRLNRRIDADKRM